MVILCSCRLDESLERLNESKLVISIRRRGELLFQKKKKSCDEPCDDARFRSSRRGRILLIDENIRLTIFFLWGRSKELQNVKEGVHWWVLSSSGEGGWVEPKKNRFDLARKSRTQIKGLRLEGGCEWIQIVQYPATIYMLSQVRIAKTGRYFQKSKYNKTGPSEPLKLIGFDGPGPKCRLTPLGLALQCFRFETEECKKSNLPETTWFDFF